MKRILRLLVLLLFSFQCVKAQITTPVSRAAFGVDANLKARYITGPITSNDDWYLQMPAAGIGDFVIDTTGAADIVARYAVDPGFRKIPFFRTMRLPPYSKSQTNKLMIDAVFIRDYHGDDSTVFASGSNKNGMSPAAWTCPVSQGIPDKNDILDMYVHVRRDGPYTTNPLWMFGGVGIENTTGNRYFDFEMYQTDIYYDRPSRRFYGYGPDAGHTSWLFDAAGNVTRPGDIIFTAEYGTASLTLVEARIWIDHASLSLTPTAFDWGGLFDGAANGSQYGYASIKPKGGSIFYTGIASPANTWAGPFSLIREDNSLSTTYLAQQFMEFSVDLTTLGLDPVTLLGGNACGMPFRRVLVKTRSSTSFTAELKDFVGPFDFFLAPRADVAADVPVYCGSVGVSEIQVTNAVATSLYTWTTPDGNIVTENTGPTITVDAPGTYIVSQQLAGGCSTYATDTITIAYDPDCVILESNLLSFNATRKSRLVNLSWSVSQNQDSKYFEVQRSSDGEHFTTVAKISANPELQVADYNTTDDISKLTGTYVFYRLKLKSNMGYIKYSKVVSIALQENGIAGIAISPNPVKDVMHISVNSDGDKKLGLFIYDFTGRLVRTHHTQVGKGISSITIDGFRNYPKGVYAVKVMMDDERFMEKVVLTQ